MLILFRSDIRQGLTTAGAHKEVEDKARGPFVGSEFYEVWYFRVVPGHRGRLDQHRNTGRDAPPKARYCPFLSSWHSPERVMLGGIKGVHANSDSLYAYPFEALDGVLPEEDAVGSQNHRDTA